MYTSALRSSRHGTHQRRGLVCSSCCRSRSSSRNTGYDSHPVPNPRARKLRELPGTNARRNRYGEGPCVPGDCHQSPPVPEPRVQEGQDPPSRPSPGAHCARAPGPKGWRGRGPYGDRKNRQKTGRAHRGPEGNGSGQRLGRSFRPASPEALPRSLTSAVHATAHGC